MNPIWYFDFISPFAYLQLARMRKLGERWPITPRPIVLGAVLRHHGQLGPAEIPGKREFTYRMAQWTAESAGLTLRFPPMHPFNPISALRLAIAAGSQWDGIAAIFDHVWKRGLAGDSAASLVDVAHGLGVADVESAINAASVKEQLRANTDEAIHCGVFGVPTVRVDRQLFWGNDATSMLEAYLRDPSMFDHGEYVRLAQLPSALTGVR